MVVAIEHRTQVLDDQLTEESFDPCDWDEFRDLAHRMVDDMLDHFRGLPNRPVWQAMPQARPV